MATESIRIRPNVVVSRCLGFEACRYNGKIIEDEFINALRKYINFIPVCPEAEIGLGVPRDPIRLIQVSEEKRLIQPETGRDVSDTMKEFAENFLSNLSEVDGFILKKNSPTCGIKDIRVYTKAGTLILKSRGYFTDFIIEKFPWVAIEDEAGLSNRRLRRHFLSKVYLLAELRHIKSIKDLIRFHTKNKLLLMSYNQRKQNELGRLVANTKEKNKQDILLSYRLNLRETLKYPPRRSSIINALNHGFGYFKQKLSQKEKNLFLKSIEDYRKGSIPPDTLLQMLKNWVKRFDNNYILNQTIFEPYPLELDAIFIERRRINTF